MIPRKIQRKTERLELRPYRLSDYPKLPPRMFATKKAFHEKLKFYQRAWVKDLVYAFSPRIWATTSTKPSETLVLDFRS